MANAPEEFIVRTIGEPQIDTPIDGLRFVDDDHRILYQDDVARVRASFEAANPPPSFERAGPRPKIYFDPAELRCGIVTCGGLCPGLNDVIRSLVLALDNLYGVTDVLGFRFGYEGLTAGGREPIRLTTESVGRIHENGGTFLGTSRGHQSAAEMVDALEANGIGLFFAVGGDGTLRGAHSIVEEIARRGSNIAVIGVPKTIDNDIAYIETSFGFETAVEAARIATRAAHMEATSAVNGVGLVKVMGRDSGFIAAGTALADSDVTICLVPENPFTIAGLMRELDRQIDRSGHAVIVVAEGAGQELFSADPGDIASDASGNVRYGDIGAFLTDQIKHHFSAAGRELNLKFIDPSYIIRSQRTNAKDAGLCLLLGQAAVHAGMSGRTDMLVGHWKQHLTHVPIPLAVSARKRLEPRHVLWQAVLTSTGQPRDLVD